MKDLSLLTSQLILIFLSFFSSLASDPTPIAYQGRFLPIENYANQWLYRIAHQTHLGKENSIDTLWKLHFFGRFPFEDTPLFWVEHRTTKDHLYLNSQHSRYNYQTLKKAIESTSVKPDNYFAAQEIEQLKNYLNLFQRLQSALQSNASLENTLIDLNLKGLSPKEIAFHLEQQYPFATRLLSAGELFKALPSKYKPGEWYSLHALHLKAYDPTTRQLEYAKNFTLYPDPLFLEIREKYLLLEKTMLENPDAARNPKRALLNLLNQGYTSIAQTPYAQALGKQLYYPSLLQLKMEAFYENYPLTFYAIIIYIVALFFMLIGLVGNRPSLINPAIATLILAFSLHTAVLLLRSYILGRPPVTNMFETILYVPWVAVFMSLLLRFSSKSLYPLISSACASIILLSLLRLNFYAANFENVQAVLDSHYWLLIHVLMVVGSYGLFLLASVLGHIYLIGFSFFKPDTLQSIAKSLLQILYTGVLLLVAGTILGGMWAAQSWGRFWDWDPKESWAFISICIYLLWIHAYRFGKISSFGLAIGSIIGFIAISFTWYGVNYILGTGLHSYGFGNGGVNYYYSYLFVELLFLLATIRKVLIRKAQLVNS